MSASAPGPSSGPTLSTHADWIEEELGRLIHTATAVDFVLASFADSAPGVFTRLLSLHGLPVASCNESDALSLLRHLLLGSCYQASHGDARPLACSFQLSSCGDCHRALSDLFNFVLVQCEYSTSQLSLMCRALGMTSSDARRARFAVSFRKFLQSTHDALVTFRGVEFWAIVDKVEKITSVPELHGLCLAHGLNIDRVLDQEHMKTILVNHLSVEGCSLSSDVSVPPSCLSEGPLSATAKMSLITSLYTNASRVHIRALKRVILACGLVDSVPEGATKNDMKRITRDFMSISRREKAPANRRACYEETVRVNGENLQRVHDSVRANWPAVVSSSVKDECLANFYQATSSAALREHPCAVCGESKTSEQLMPSLFSPSEIDVGLLRVNRPSYIPDPFAFVPSLRGVMLEPAGVDLNDDASPMIRVCTACSSCLVNRNPPVLPKNSLANQMYISAVPPELRNLSLVEEAMIARRRAKCWVLHLNGDEASTSGSADNTATRPVLPTTQRGVRGHVVVYPSDPKNIGHLLPPPIDEVCRYACIVFVGSQRPSREWLLTKAKPLLVRPHKVRAALLWLKSNNPLYSDIIVNDDVLGSLPVESILPVEISVQQHSIAAGPRAARYEPTPLCSCTSQCSCSISPDVFHSFLVSDVEGEGVSSCRMAAAALKHLHSGGRYIGVHHDPELVNTYDDENLFPLLYPTLFPFGTGGFELSGRPTNISFPAQARHYFNLHDKRFQTHTTFLFTVFSILQRRAVSLSARLKTKNANFANIAQDLNSISRSTIDAILSRHVKGLPPDFSNPEEVLVSKLMRQVSLVSSKVPGTSAARVTMRNEIRAMMIHHGLPSFYITINPADMYSPLVKFLAGADINLEDLPLNQAPEYWQQAVQIGLQPYDLFIA